MKAELGSGLDIGQSLSDDEWRYKVFRHIQGLQKVATEIK